MRNLFLPQNKITKQKGTIIPRPELDICKWAFVDMKNSLKQKFKNLEQKGTKIRSI